MDLSSVVPVSSEVVPHHGLDPRPFEVRSGKRPWVEQYLPYVLREGIPVPDPEVKQLVPAEKTAFDVERRKQTIDWASHWGIP